ncbi:hypothetical protein ACWKSP_41110 [Micromonosporaceae bacterium Da 78-11]
MTQVLDDQVTGGDNRRCSGAPYERQARADPTTSDDAHEGGDEFAATVLVERVLRLQQQIAALAGDAADTERHLAQVFRRLAQQNPARSTVYLAAGDQADRFAAHKSEEQRRWRLT